MKYKLLGLTVLLVAFAGSALAQTQVSAALKCDNKARAPGTPLRSATIPATC